MFLDGVWLLDRMDCPVKLFLVHLEYFGDMQNDPRLWMSYDVLG